VRRLPAAVVLAAVLLVTVTACDDQDGRALPPPSPDTTTTTTTTTAAPGASVGTGDDRFRLRSPAAAGGQELPTRFTCFGAGVSPPLGWENAPPATEYAIVARDLDADGFVHWVVTGLDPTVRGFDAAGLPEGAAVGPNDAGGQGWTPPCPPEGTHRYLFAVHALAEPIVLDATMPAERAASLVERASTAQAVLTVMVSAAD
jgi:Raf kinase inhibitor-like YbhB/YbcL family protein